MRVDELGVAKTQDLDGSSGKSSSWGSGTMGGSEYLPCVLSRVNHRFLQQLQSH